jgi:thiol-disulfide isomerase/thioredoxin
MKYFLVALLFGLLGNIQAQQIKTVTPEWIDGIHASKSDTLYIINFWATWCKPCVEELPYFEQLADTCTNKKVKIYLVTTDMRKDISTRVTDFIKAKKLTQQVVFINELNADKWINKVSEEWSGAIPATLMIKGDIGYKHFKEGELTFEELQLLVNQVIP